MSSDWPHWVNALNGGDPGCYYIRILVLVTTYLRLEETDPIRRALVLPSGKIETNAAEAFSFHS